jgi:hypothetical protein
MRIHVLGIGKVPQQVVPFSSIGLAYRWSSFVKIRTNLHTLHNTNRHAFLLQEKQQQKNYVQPREFPPTWSHFPYRRRMKTINQYTHAPPSHFHAQH